MNEQLAKILMAEADIPHVVDLALLERFIAV